MISPGAWAHESYCMTNSDTKITKGGCFCGAVQYEVAGALRDVINCHCSQCTKLNGGVGAHSKARKENIRLTKDEGLSWYEISENTRRGFCHKCGSGLFWQPGQQDATGIVAGSIDGPTGLKTIGHIFVSEKSDFYEITNSLQQFQGSSNGELAGDYL